jgi:hypothetical protein
MTNEARKYFEFSNEDEQETKKYFDWMYKNQEGYVIDDKQKRNRREYIYHKSRCPHIADESPKFSYTGRPKICSADLKGLKNWFKDNNISMSKARPCAKGCLNKNLPASLS